MSPLLAHLLSCLPQRPRGEVEALARALEERGITTPGELPQVPSAGLTRRQQTALLSAAEIGPCVDLRWREALEAEGGAGLLRLVTLEAGIRSAGELADWPIPRISRVWGIGQGERLLQIRRAAARCGVAWGADIGGEIPPVVPPAETTPPPLSATWRDALHLAGGVPLVRRALAAGIDSPEGLARLSSGDVARLGGWGRVRLGQLRRAALSLGLDWAPDLERGPGQPSLSGEGESPRETVSLPPAVRAQVRARAEEEGISASAWIRRAIEAALTAGESGSGSGDGDGTVHLPASEAAALREAAEAEGVSRGS